jgi:hypothetical protein
MLMLAAAVLPLAGCGGSSSPTNASITTIAGSCNNAASGFCNEFTGSAYKPAGVERACKRPGVNFLAGACPTDGQIGTCLVLKGQNSESYYRYYASFPGSGITPAGGAAAEAERQCTLSLKGEWTAR